VNLWLNPVHVGGENMKSWFSKDRRFGWRDLLVLAVGVSLFAISLPFEYQYVYWASYTARVVCAVVLSAVLSSGVATLVAIALFG
jgi:hypothetical protein